MRVSLKSIKKYVKLPDDLTAKQIAYDLTLKTVEVEDVINIKEKFHDIIVGKIEKVKSHPNADSLRVCIVDIGEKESVQIVCGGSNLYEGEYVIVCKPGAEVVWHGEGEPVVIKETKMRGENSYGMICASTEVYLENLFPLSDPDEIVDLKGIDCYPGQNICDVVGMDDVILEIDNKSLTNRPDLWGHYGIARELSAIYKAPLMELPKYELDNLPKYDVEILEPEKCNRYVGIEIDNVYDKKSPMWMQAALINAGMRPINAIVDITNYVMIETGQPLHAFDKTHVRGNKIIVRNASKGETLELLDDNNIELTTDDLVICDKETTLALAGIRGGKNDSILPETTSVLLEIANFNAGTIRKSGKRFDEKTDSSIRYEKQINTQRVDDGMNLALTLFKELFPECEIVSYGEVYPIETKKNEIVVSQEFLNVRLGKELDKKVIIELLEYLGYEVTFNKGEYKVIVPTWRSTGDVSIKDDVMGDIARILGYQSFEAKALTINHDKCVIQNNILLERRIREYLAYRCGMNEIFTYPWIDEKYINAARIDTSKLVRLATPPSPEQANLRGSLVPGLIEAVNKNLRYYDEFKIFEVAQVFEKGEYSPSSEDEVLPIHKKYVSGCAVGKDAKKLFYDIKGIIENMSSYCHMEKLNFEQIEKPGWADKNVYLNVILNGELIGSLGLISVSTMNDAKIKYSNVCMFEIDYDKLVSYTSRTNKYEEISSVPLVEKDIAVLIDENVSWADISKMIRGKVKKLEFIEEYKGSQIETGKKSVTFRIWFGNGKTMTSEEINNDMNKVIRTLNKCFGAELRLE